MDYHTAGRPIRPSRCQCRSQRCSLRHADLELPMALKRSEHRRSHQPNADPDLRRRRQLRRVFRRGLEQLRFRHQRRRPLDGFAAVDSHADESCPYACRKCATLSCFARTVQDLCKRGVWQHRHGQSSQADDCLYARVDTVCGAVGIDPGLSGVAYRLGRRTGRPRFWCERQHRCMGLEFGGEVIPVQPGPGGRADPDTRSRSGASFAGSAGPWLQPPHSFHWPQLRDDGECRGSELSPGQRILLDEYGDDAVG